MLKRMDKSNIHATHQAKGIKYYEAIQLGKACTDTAPCDTCQMSHQDEAKHVASYESDVAKCGNTATTSFKSVTRDMIKHGDTVSHKAPMYNDIHKKLESMAISTVSKTKPDNFTQTSFVRNDKIPLCKTSQDSGTTTPRDTTSLSDIQLRLVSDSPPEPIASSSHNAPLHGITRSKLAHRIVTLNLQHVMDLLICKHLQHLLHMMFHEAI